MIQDAFQHRSGRVIAFGRAVLALFFLLVLWADRSQPAIAPQSTYIFLGAYAAASIFYMLATWRNWWLETRLAPAAHVVDLLVFTSLNFATQGYASPFFTFFVFLLLSASIRWGWRETALTAGAIIILYLFEGRTAQSWGTESFELRRFAIRSSYLVVLSSMILLWFASNQRASETGLSASRETEGGAIYDIAAVLQYARERFGSCRAIFAWSESEEPWTFVASLSDEGFEQVRFEPEAIDPLPNPALGDGPVIFDQRSGRSLRRSGRRRVPLTVSRPLNPDFAAHFDMCQGVRIPVRSSAIEGELFVLDVPSLCSDDLALAEEVRHQISVALEHAELFRATQDAAAMRARLSLARDIHDSVVQFLAGLTLRLEGVRKAARAGGKIDAEVDDLQRELGREQQDLRRFIAELRGGRPAGPRVDLSLSIRTLLERMASQWGVRCQVEGPLEGVPVPAPLERDVHQLVREAVANAVRHGHATAIDTRIRRVNGTVELEIEDNGSGFPVCGEFDEAALEAERIGPRSLRERVRNLQGTLRLASTPKGSRLLIRLPLKRDGAPCEY